MGRQTQLEMVIAALVARRVSRRKLVMYVAQYLAYESIERRLPTPHVNFDLGSLPKSRCIDRFRFTAPQIKALHRLLNFPATIRTAQGVPVPGIEALCLVLRRLSFPCRYPHLSYEFGRQGPVLCSTFMISLLLIYRRVAKKMAFDELIFTSYADASAKSVYKKVGYVNNCVAFIDGTIRRICRPVQYQGEAYSGFKKCHCIKFQGVMMANGLVVSLHGPIEGRRHDSFILTDSKIATKMKALFPGSYLYGDAGYGIKDWLLRPFQTSGLTAKQKKFNKALSRARVSVEWFFGEVVQYWAHVDFKKGMKIGKSPVGAMYIVATFLTNALMCANQMSKSSRYFRCPLPQLEEYLANVDRCPENGEEQDVFSDADSSDVGEEEDVDFYDDEGPSDDCICSTITRERLQCLLPMQWLHDDVINYWFALLKDRDTKLHERSIVSSSSHFFNSFFYTQLTRDEYSHSRVSRWTRQIDIFAMDKLFIPVNIANSHWCLAVVFVQQRRIQYYDSFLGPGHGCLKNLLLYLCDEMRDKEGAELDRESWVLQPTTETTPQQGNGSDCGLFTCIFADHISRNHPLTCSQRDMPFHRRRMVLRIMQGELPFHEDVYN